MSDAYESTLWDISPYCQVAGICGISKNQDDINSDTLILDGAFGASIQWKSFIHVKSQTAFSWKRWLCVQIMENNGMLLSIALFAWAIGRDWDGSGSSLISFMISVVNWYDDVHPGKDADADGLFPWWLRHFTALCTGVAAIFFILYIWSWLATPGLIKQEYGGKFRDVQASLCGFEGYLNIATIERSIFGGNFKRLRWSINGSPLSRSYTDEHGDRFGMDPTLDAQVRQRVEFARRAEPGQMRVSFKPPLLSRSRMKPRLWFRRAMLTGIDGTCRFSHWSIPTTWRSRCLKQNILLLLSSCAQAKEGCKGRLGVRMTGLLKPCRERRC